MFDSFTTHVILGGVGGMALHYYLAGGGEQGTHPDVLLPGLGGGIFGAFILSLAHSDSFPLALSVASGALGTVIYDKFLTL